jgi:hypothetical protein
MARYGLDTPHPIIYVESEQIFWDEVRKYTHERHDRDLRQNIRGTIESVRHKLNIVRYSAGLIQTLSEDDYAELKTPLFPSRPQVSTAKYQDRCTFEMHNQNEYRLFLTLFVENFSAASFSLFDVCGYLIRHMFSQPTNVTKINYWNSVELIQGYPTTYEFLCRYKTTYKNVTPLNQVSWIDPLNELRNRMTHRPITDIFHENRSKSIYSPTIESFLLDRAIFGNQQQDEELKAFVKTCFDGLEDFVSQLYECLIFEIQIAQAVPIQ